jgi:endonuclease YncB( thermonuclease family)
MNPLPLVSPFRVVRRAVLSQSAGILVLVTAAIFGCAAKSRDLTGRVVAIADGDTLTVLDSSHTQHKIRLAGIDAPEKAQAYGNRARQALAAKVFDQWVRVEVIDVDRYRREVGRIYLGDRFINAEMVEDGLAWRYPQYDKRGEFTGREAEAREHHRGLWADDDPLPPWEFRRLKRDRAKLATRER